MRRHGAWVMSVALRRCCGRVELAEEAAQNVFAALARKATGLRNLDNAAPWLHRAAVLETAALLRRELRQRRLVRRQAAEEETGRSLSFGAGETLEGAATEAAAAAVAVASVKAAEEAWQAVRGVVDEALQALGAGDRELLVLHHVEGRGFAEIAKELGTSEAAAQRRGHRALGKLAGRLRRMGLPRLGSGTPALALALAAGMRGETAAAAAVVAASGRLVEFGGRLGAGAAGAGVSGSAVSGSLAAATGSTASPLCGAAAGLLPAWAASPAFLVTVGLLSAALPIWRGAGQGPGAASGGSPAGSAPAGPGAELAAGSGAAEDQRKGGPAGGRGDFTSVAPETRLAFLRQALERLGQSPEGPETESLGIRLRRYMLELEAGELEAVGALLAEVKGNRSGLRDVTAAFSGRLAALKPELAAELLRTRKEEGPQQALAKLLDESAVLDVLSRSALPEAFKACEKDDGLKNHLVMMWSAHAPRAAMEYAEEILKTSPKALDRSTYLFPWMQQDPAGMVRWMDTNAESHPDIQARAVSIHPGGYAGWIVQQLPPSEAVKLTLDLHDPLIRNSFISAVYSDYGRTQPELLTDLAPLMQLRDGAKPLSVSGFVNNWRRKDANAAAAWAEGLPAGKVKSTALRVLASPLPEKK